MSDCTLKLYFGDSGPDPLRPATTRASGDGWQPGAPSHITAADLEVDLSAYRRLQCPDCGRQHMRLEPQHQATRYQIVATCACSYQVTL